MEVRMPRSRRDKEVKPLTLGQALTAGVPVITWCKQCEHEFEPDVAELVARYGAKTTVADWAKRLRCSRCGGGATLVISGAPR